MKSRYKISTPSLYRPLSDFVRWLAIKKKPNYELIRDIKQKQKQTKTKNTKNCIKKQLKETKEQQQQPQASNNKTDRIQINDDCLEVL